MSQVKERAVRISHTAFPMVRKLASISKRKLLWDVHPIDILHKAFEFLFLFLYARTIFTLVFIVQVGQFVQLSR